MQPMRTSLADGEAFELEEKSTWVKIKFFLVNLGFKKYREKKTLERLCCILKKNITFTT